MSKLIVLICLISSISFTLSCKCRKPDDTTAEGLIASSDEVFIGKVIHITRGEDINSFIKVRFEVSKVYLTSSNLKAGDMILISTCGNSACCGNYFENLNDYIVYSNERSTNSCTSTKALTDAENDVRLLDDHFKI